MADSAHTSDLEAALDAVKKLPAENQAEIARFLHDYVEEQHAPSLLSNDQKAEVARRLANTNRKLVAHEEVVTSVRRLLGNERRLG